MLNQYAKFLKVSAEIAWRKHRTGLKTVQRRTKKCWIDVTNPTPDEANSLTRDLNIPSEFITYPLNSDKIPLVEKADGALLRRSG
jgi:Mg2+ and Co2+ transporter CorA